METERLRQLLVLAKTQSLSASASSLGMTPGALSKSLRVLADQLGIELYESQGRGLVLTEQAWALVDRAEKILRSVEDLKQSTERQTDSPDVLRLSSFEVFTGRFFAQLLDSLPEKLNLDLLESLPGKIEKDIATKIADIGISYQPVPTDGVSFTKIGKFQMVLLGQKQFSNVHYSELPFIAPQSRNNMNPSRSLGLDGWDDARFRRHIFHSVVLLETGLQLAQRGRGVIFVPKFVADSFNEQVSKRDALTVLDCGVPRRMGAQDVFLITRVGEADTPLCRAVAKSLRKICMSRGQKAG